MSRKFKSAEEQVMAEKISGNIKELMRQKRYRQTDLSDKTGIKRSTMSDYVNGKTIVPTQAIKKIAKALGSTEAQIFGDEIHITEVDNLVVELERKLEKANQRIEELEEYIKQGAKLL
ncbi:MULTISPECIES: helix-turn-helix transcriptional regulator [Bacillales]|uniref:helix-turn-helix domain-containing protein n=1 Tax=Bacillales TaxID=1385 RepID=UPI001909F36F|nr:helix-turn-helix transcriptional regulator [Staphylococcus aureus]MBK3311793.1 helix-turn-helix domain-containing protein [Staphylococcus aureus]WAI28714.1 MAG: helix-turn-helix transcriptional regulator [Bacillus paranthracis]WAI33477.1 MAG: helix-turn-helix transcriptional regulator [Bacillus paranthracis]WAI38387.1 MAG: helix-turn-helix transcriptional regulator [Bacillus paranthracis]